MDMDKNTSRTRKRTRAGTRTRIMIRAKTMTRINSYIFVGADRAAQYNN